MTDKAAPDADDHSDDPRIGVLLQDRYRITRKLGEGGMGAVYEAEHILIKRKVAIKCLHADFARKPAIVARFHREAQAATAIGNEHIIEVLDMGTFPDGAAFIVLEYLDGHDFAWAIKHESPLALSRVARIVCQICEALSPAHAKGIIHRDIKPENIFLIPRGEEPDFVKVLDFGISKFTDENDPGSNAMTRTGMAMGTPYYMAPEQAEGRKGIDHRVDLYALGVMMFRALTKTYPFQNKTFPMLIVDICTKPPPPIRFYRTDLPEEFENIINKLLAKQKEDRFVDCAALKQALLPFRTESEILRAFAPTSVGEIVPALSPMPFTPPSTNGLAQVISPQPWTAQPFVAQQYTHPVSNTSARFTEAPRREGNGFKIFSLVALVAVILGIGAFFKMRHGRHTELPVVHVTPLAPHVVQTEGPDVVQNVPMHVELVPNVPEIQPVQHVSGVHVLIETTPDDAVLTLDNDRIANPFDGELPESTAPRRLEASAHGYTSVVQDLVLRFPQTVRIRMHRGQGVDDQRRTHVTTAPATEHSTVEPAQPAAAPEHAAPPPANSNGDLPAEQQLRGRRF